MPVSALPPTLGATPRSDGCPGCGAPQSAAIRRWTKPTPPTGTRRLRRPRCPEPGKPAHQLGQHQPDSIPVLDVGGVNHYCQEQSHGVHYDVSFTSRYPFTCAFASRLLFLWSSRLAVDEGLAGVASQPSLSRTMRRSASSTRSQSGIGSPLTEILPDRPPRGQVVGHHPPGNATARSRTREIASSTSPCSMGPSSSTVKSRSSEKL